MSCLTSENIENNGGFINENSDGSVSVFINNNGILIPNQLNKICCESLKNTYFFDIDKQICKWGTGTTITNLTEPVKITINPIGNDGALFLINDNETCALNISFDYLFNVNCEKLGDILNDTTINSSQIELITNIKLYTGLIENTKADCDIIRNNIDELNKQISQTNYSIFCDMIPIIPISQNIVPLNQNNSFSNTAFGNTSIPQSPVILPNTQYETVNYCLTEPLGLNEWSKILGVKYQAFLNGDSLSYTCDDVIAIKAVHDNIGGVLFNCTTEFGVKSNLVNDLNILLTDKTNCETYLSVLENNLVNYNNQLEIIGDTIITAPIDFFETLDVSVTLEVISGLNQTQTVFVDNFFPAIGHGNLYNYLISNNSSGFYVCGNPSPDSIGLSGCTPFILPTKAVSTSDNTNPCDIINKEPRDNASSCDLINKSISSDLFIESGLDSDSIGKDTFINTLPNNSFVSNWINYSVDITDVDILELIRDKKVKITININKIGGDFCVLLDNIVLNRNCEKVISNSIFVTESPSFNLEKVIDNKKSWNDKTNRKFFIGTNTNTNIIRETNYDVNDDKLIINTKEIDLDINISSAIENDVWRYMLDNPCLLSGVCDTNCCDPCSCLNKQFQDDECFSFQDSVPYNFMDDNIIGGKGCCGDMIDFNKIKTTPLSAITTLQDFKYFISTELIDAKSRQTILGYGTLKALYDRYLNSSLYCSNTSSSFSYMTIENFAKLVGDYWSDIVEQVIPATTIWGSVKIYSNTIFDQQKFKYKSYSTLFGGNPYSGKIVSSPINGEYGICQGVSVVSVPIDISNTGITIGIGDGKYDQVCLSQMNYGSEFIGSVKVIY